MTSRLTRRSFVIGGGAVLSSAALFVVRDAAVRTGVLLSAFEDARGDQYVGGLSLTDARVFGARVPMRAHGCAQDPRDPQRTVFFARRPGTQAFELHRDSMQVQLAFTTSTGRHLAGHGVFSASGEFLLTPEHDYENVRGVIAVRDARSFAVVREINTRGIDPHEIAWLPDRRSLLVANGGILTHPKSYRRKLNIATMDPSLCVIDSGTGDCLDQQRLEDHQLSIRHLALASDGTAVLGLQYEGQRERAPGVAAIYRAGARLHLLTTPAEEAPSLNGYVASVALSESHDVVAAACPYGAGVACWSLSDGRYRGVISAEEAYGVSRLADGSLIASQRDGGVFGIEESRLRSRFVTFSSVEAIRWDDHWAFAEG
jgi:hypothetical protein